MSLQRYAPALHLSVSRRATDSSKNPFNVHSVQCIYVGFSYNMMEANLLFFFLV